MKNKIFLSLVFAAALSCHSTPPNEKTVDDRNTDTPPIPDKAQTIIDPPGIQNKYDSLILAYIKSTDKELIRSAVETNEKIEWLFDRTEQTDSATYYIFNIGQDVTDENNTNPRFSSDGWIHIDSASGKLYEYDLPNEKLILWENNKR